MNALARSRSYGWLFWSLALVGLIADQASKYGINSWLDQNRNHIQVGGLEHRGYEIIPGMFSLVRQERLNRGALFGFGNNDESGHIANAIFATVSTLAALGIIVWSFRSSVRGSMVLSIALGLILAGALGNLCDRLALGGVRDFIWVYYQGPDGQLLKLNLPLFETANFPVFNLADSCLCVGAGLLLLQTFFVKGPAKPQAAAQTQAAPAAPAAGAAAP